MKPTNDQFEQQVRGLYEGYEVPAPASTKDAVFNKLDAANTSGSFASKSLLIAASILTVGAIYMLSDAPTQAPVEAIEVVETFEAPVVEQAVEIQVATEEVVEEVIKTPVIEAPVEVIEAPVVVETPIEVIEVVETPVVQEIKEVAPPVEVVETETVVEEKQEEEKKEVEWVLPASIKVEK